MAQGTTESDRKGKRKNWLVYAALILCSILAVWLYIYTTPEGVGLTNDSAAYLGGARSILQGRGYVRFSGDHLPRPITQFPPLYAIKIAGLAKLFQTDVFQAAWILNLCCYVLNLVLFALLVLKLSKSKIAAMIACPVFLCCGPILQAHVYGLSEAYSMVPTLAILWLTWDFSEKQRFTPFWLLPGFLAGILFLIRYAGVSILITVFLFSLASLPGIRRKIETGFAMLLGFIVPLIPWLISSANSGESVVNRAFEIHIPGSEVIHDGILNISGFFLPEVFGVLTKTFSFWKVFWPVFLAGLTVWVLIQFFNRIRSNGDRALSAEFLLALAIVIYMAVLIGVAIFVDGSTVFDNRMLLPFYILTSLLLLILSAELAQKQSPVKWVGILLPVLFVIFLLEDEIDLIQTYHKDGQGFASSTWSESETALAAETFPKEQLFFSNRQTYLWLMKDHPAYILPVLRDAALQQDNAEFEEEKTWMQEEILSGKAYAVVFNYQDLLEDSSDKAWLDTLFEGMPVFGTYADGIIFGQK